MGADADDAQSSVQLVCFSTPVPTTSVSAENPEEQTAASFPFPFGKESQFLKAQCGSSHSRLPVPGWQCEGNRRDTLTSHQAHSWTQSLLTENTRKSERASCAFCCFCCFVLSQYNYWSCLGEEEQQRCWLLHGWKLLLSPGTAACVLCSELAHIKISG